MLANESAGVSTCHHSIPPVHGLSNLYLHAMEARVVWGNQKACSEKSPQSKAPRNISIPLASGNSAFYQSFSETISSEEAKMHQVTDMYRRQLLKHWPNTKGEENGRTQDQLQLPRPWLFFCRHVNCMSA